MKGRALAALGVVSLAGSVEAAGPEVSVAATRAQNAMTLTVEPEGIRARACRRAPCETNGAELLAFPDDVDGRATKLETLRLDAERAVAIARAPGRGGGRGWVAVLSSSDAGTEPEVVTSLVGHLGRDDGGLEGERRSRVLVREPTEDGARLLVGSRYEHADVCGREAVLEVRWLDPATMSWGAVGARSLSAEERAGARKLSARRTDRSYAEHPRVLGRRLASSAVARDPSHATDHAPATRWAEARPGDGRGEFLALSSTMAVPIEGLELLVTADDDPKAATPERFYVATPESVYEVAMPEDAGEDEAGTIYEVSFPEAVRTDCVTIVLGAGDVGGDRDRVGFAEVRAVTPFDGKTPVELVSALEGDHRAAAQALLLRGGSAALEATMTEYAELSPRGRRAALEVIDAGPCAKTAPFFARMLVGVDRDAGDDFEPALDRLSKHARDRLRGCRQAAGRALVEVMAEAGPTQRRIWAARELASIAPRDAIDAIVDVLAEGSKAPEEPGSRDDVRRGLRAALAIAAQNDRAARAVDAALAPEAFAERSLVERIDLLRAIGPRLPSHEGAPAALSQVLEDDDSFRTRYLLLEPASHLAAAGDARATELLAEALAGDRPPLRAQAARVSAGIEALTEPLVGALSDDNPRVRAAALGALAESPPQGTDVTGRIAELLASDRWTFVRRQAAHALGGTPRSERADGALVAALEDDSARVRRAALEAIGRRGQTEAGEDVHELADDARQKTDTRVAAIRALGALCRVESTDLLTKLARRAGYQQLPYDRPLGLAALATLGELHPPDLHQRLAPLLANSATVPPAIRRIARSVLTQEERCGDSP